jgi:hypothetical protein
MELVIKKNSVNRGATIWFKMFGAIVWNLLIINHFLLNFLKNQDWKLYWNLGAFLELLESPHQVWFNKVDFVILRCKMWTILLNFWWVHIVVGNSNKLQKGVWKENSIEFSQTSANGIGYITIPPLSFHTNINYFRGTVKKKNYEGGSAKCETNKIN